MVLYENTLIQFKKDIRRKKLVSFLCAEYESVSKKTVSGEIRYAWRYTFQIISSLLDRMGSEANPEAVSIVDARECIEYVITVSRKLGALLDQYRF